MYQQCFSFVSTLYAICRHLWLQNGKNTCAGDLQGGGRGGSRQRAEWPGSTLESALQPEVPTSHLGEDVGAGQESQCPLVHWRMCTTSLMYIVHPILGGAQMMMVGRKGRSRVQVLPIMNWQLNLHPPLMEAAELPSSTEPPSSAELQLITMTQKHRMKILSDRPALRGGQIDLITK